MYAYAHTYINRPHSLLSSFPYTYAYTYPPNTYIYIHIHTYTEAQTLAAQLLKVRQKLDKYENRFSEIVSVTGLSDPGE